LFDGIMSIRGFAADLVIAVSTQKRAHALPHYFMIIHDQDFHSSSYGYRRTQTRSETYAIAGD
jgi:hypothetical protein